MSINLVFNWKCKIINLDIIFHIIERINNIVEWYDFTTSFPQPRISS